MTQNEKTLWLSTFGTALYTMRAGHAPDHDEIALAASHASSAVRCLRIASVIGHGKLTTEVKLTPDTLAMIREVTA